MFFGRNLLYLVSCCDSGVYPHPIDYSPTKIGEPKLPVYRSDRGDICSDRILRRPEKLSAKARNMSHGNPSQTQPSAWSKRTVSTNGLRIRIWHAGSGPPLVLVHGLLGYSFSWRHALPILAQSAEVFAPDMPGAGFSDCDSRLDCRLSSAAERLLNFLDAAGIGACDLMGSSYGGTTAMKAAIRAPSRVKRLILVSPANPWSRIGGKRLRVLQNPVIAWAFPKCARPFRGLHGYFVRRMYGDTSKVTWETLDGYARPLGLPGRFEHAVKIVKSWSADMEELDRGLSAIARIPTLILWGSKDRVVDPSSATFLARRLGNPEMAVIPGTGHMPYEEAPQEFCQIVIGFLARTAALVGK